MAFKNLALPTSQPNSLTKHEGGKLRQAFTDRLLLSEAIDAVGKMIRGYANRGSADKSYIGAIAELLMQYPRSLALECAEPLHGVVLTTAFMPTPADIARWMEDHLDRMKGRVEREEGAEKQLRERREYEAKIKNAPEPLKNNRYNLLVRPGRPGYEQMCERAKYSHELDFCYEARGIWVPIEWYLGRQGWRPPQESPLEKVEA